MGKSCLAASVLAAVALSARSGATEEATVVRDGGVLIDGFRKLLTVRKC